MTIHHIDVKFARSLPDPIHKGRGRHIMLVDVTDLPLDISKDANPRSQNIDRGIWREIRKHLLKLTVDQVPDRQLARDTSPAQGRSVRGHTRS